jgi:putative flippase GtrA
LSSTRTTPGLIQRVADLYRRFRHVIHEGAKFLIVGAVGIGVTNLVFIPLHGPLGLGPLTSVTIATVAATVVTFLGNRYWSFRHRAGAGTAREGLTFFVLNGVGLLIQYAVLGFSNYALGLTTRLENVIALNLGIGLGTLFRFWSYRKWVWVPHEVALDRLRHGRHRKGRTDADSARTEPAVVGTGNMTTSSGSAAPPAGDTGDAAQRQAVPPG